MMKWNYEIAPQNQPKTQSCWKTKGSFLLAKESQKETTFYFSFYLKKNYLFFKLLEGFLLGCEMENQKYKILIPNNSEMTALI